MTTSLKPNIYFVTAESEQSNSATEHLAERGFHVEVFGQGTWLYSQLQKFNPDLVVFEMSSQSLKGIEACKEIRAMYQGPLMIVTDHGDEAIQVLGLEAGADDFLIRPVSPALLLARVRALLRRGRGKHESSMRLQVTENLTIDLKQREVLRDGSPVGLTTREFDLLLILAQNAGKIISREDLYQALFNTDYNGCDRSVDIYVSRLRQKFNKYKISPRLLKTVRGSGYMMVNNC